MSRRPVLEECMICGETPCVCFGKPKPHVTARASRNARKRAVPVNPAPSPEHVPPTPTKAVLRPPQPRQSAATIGNDDPPEPTFAQIADHDDELAFASAIAALAPILHPDDQPKTPEQRAAAFRAKRWKERVYGQSD